MAESFSKIHINVTQWFKSTTRIEIKTMDGLPCHCKRFSREDMRVMWC